MSTCSLANEVLGLRFAKSNYKPQKWEKVTLMHDASTVLPPGKSQPATVGAKYTNQEEHKRW